MRGSRATGCPLCLADGAPAFTKDGYAHRRCSRCGSLFVEPVPSAAELAAFYAGDGGQQNSAICWSGSSRHAHHVWRWALDLAGRLGGAGPLLDVGCGAGQFLAFARELGWRDAEGIELSPAAADLAARSSGARITRGDVLEAGLPPARFAAITMWDVFEHVPEPRALLARCLELLRPGGVAVVSTPNLRGLSLRVRGSRSLLIMPPEHLTLATAQGLRTAMEEAGLVARRTRTVDLHLRDWVALAGGALGRSPAPEGGVRAAHASSYASVTGFRLFDAAQAAANLLLGATGLGDQLVMIGQRPGAPG